MSRYDYDLLVIGGGAGGFVSSKLARGFGKRVGMVDKAKIGGDCTWFGCIPSKTLLMSAHIAHQTRRLEDFGLKSEHPIELNTDGVMSHVRSIVEKVYNTHLPEAFEELGIDVIHGEPRFIDNHTVSIGDMRLTARRFIISTGSRALIPPIDGIDETPYLTNKTIFSLNKLPKSMIVLGGGPIGVELASAMNRLGVDVTIVEMLERILPREDEEMVGILSNILKEEGVKILTNTTATRLSRGANDNIILSVRDGEGKTSEIKSDVILIAVGRRPNLEGLELETAGVQYTPKGIITDDTLKTTAPNIYACGDVVGPYQFSHMAEYQAIIATRNAFLPIKQKIDYTHVIWSTFTDPELAHAGLTENEARERYGDGIKVYRYRYSDIDRARTDRTESGMSKFICDKSGRLIGAHVLGRCAAEVIHEAQLAKSLNIPFYKIRSVIHAYPSYTDVLRQPAKLCYIDRLQQNPFVRLLKKLF